MGIIFGRKNCNYNQDWVVRLNLKLGQASLMIAEQLRYQEAVDIYEEVKKKLQDKTDFIEIQTEQNSKDNNLEFFLKRHILSVEIFRGRR